MRAPSGWSSMPEKPLFLCTSLVLQWPFQPNETPGNSSAHEPHSFLLLSQQALITQGEVWRNTATSCSCW